MGLKFLKIGNFCGLTYTIIHKYVINTCVIKIYMCFTAKTRTYRNKINMRDKKKADKNPPCKMFKSTF
jgi:hypothetical protein